MDHGQRGYWRLNLRGMVQDLDHRQYFTPVNQVWSSPRSMYLVVCCQCTDSDSLVYRTHTYSST